MWTDFYANTLTANFFTGTSNTLYAKLRNYNNVLVSTSLSGREMEMDLNWENNTVYRGG